MIDQVKQINTSNRGKAKEYEQFLGQSISMTKIDLEEPDTDPSTVVVYKASQMPEGTLVEDTSLDVEGAEIGVNVKWMLDNLTDFIGRQATFRVIIGINVENMIYLFKGEVVGEIVEPEGEGFGFDPVFKPVGSDQTLAQSKPNQYNPRYLAVEDLKKGRWFKISNIMQEWDGPWQDE